MLNQELITDQLLRVVHPTHTPLTSRPTWQRRLLLALGQRPLHSVLPGLFPIGLVGTCFSLIGPGSRSVKLSESSYLDDGQHGHKAPL